MRPDSHRYERLNHIGEGTYGDVFLALDKDNGNEKVALKQVKISRIKLDRLQF